MWTAGERAGERSSLAFLLLRDFGQVIKGSVESSVTLRVRLNGVRIPAPRIFVLLSTCLKTKIMSHPSEHRYYERTCNPWGLICAFVALWADKSLGTGNSSNLAGQETNQNTR